MWCDSRNTLVAAREIGSNFGSVAEEAEEHVVAGLIVMRTLDHRDYDALTTIERFSNGSMGPEYHNVERICIYMAQRGFPCD